MKEPTVLRKHLPIIWATIEDALAAQEAEARGETVLTSRNAEGYLVVDGSFKLFTLPQTA